MAAIEDKCIRTLAHKCTEHAAVTALEILTHLKTTCGKIDEGMLEDNLENMKKDWDPNDTFETLVQQIENAVDLAEEGGDPISNTAQLNCGCKRVHNTGLFNVECTTWRNKAAADKNWATFKVFFGEAHDDFVLQQTTQATGCHQANNAAMEQFTADTQASFENLALAAAADRESLKGLAEANNALLLRIQQQDEQMTRVLNDNNNINGHNQWTRNNNNRNRNTTGGNTNTDDNNDESNESETGWSRPPRRQGTRQAKARRPDNKKKWANPNHCHTHECDCDDDHDSKTCRNPGKKHKKEATRENNMGGCQWAKDKIV